MNEPKLTLTLVEGQWKAEYPGGDFILSPRHYNLIIKTLRVTYAEYRRKFNLSRLQDQRLVAEKKTLNKTGA